MTGNERRRSPAGARLFPAPLRRRLALLLLFALPLLGLSARPIAANSSQSGSHSSGSAPPFADQLGTLVRQVGSFQASDYASRAAELLEQRPVLGGDALILQAGASLPIGLTARRTNELEALRTAILSDMRASIEAGDVAGGRWLRRLGELLDPDRPLAAPDLMAAAMRVGAVLDRYELAPWIAARLGARDGRLEVAARAALYELYGAWLPNEAAFELLPRGGPDQGERLKLVLMSEAGEVLALRTQLLERDPSTALAAFDSPDPRVRAAAARALTLLGEMPAGDALELERQGAPLMQELRHQGDGLTLLAERLTLEQEPAAYQAALEVFTRLGYGKPAVQNHALGRDPAHQPAHLAHLWLAPLAELTADPGFLEERVALGSRLFLRGFEEPSTLGADGLAAALDAWGALLSGTTSPSMEAVRPVLGAVQRLLSTPSEGRAVRQAAVRALSSLALIDEVRAWSLTTLEDTGAPGGLRVAAWGMVGQAGELVKGADRRRAIVALQRDLDSVAPEVAQAAFEALADPAFRKGLATEDVDHALVWAARQLAARTRNGRTEALLDLLDTLVATGIETESESESESNSESGPATATQPACLQALGLLVESEEPEALLRAQGDRLVRLRDLFLQLADGDDAARLIAARWLTSEFEGAEPDPARRRVQLEAALRLAIDRQNLGAEGHVLVLTWSEEFLLNATEEVRGRWLQRNASALLETHGSKDTLTHPHLFALALEHSGSRADIELDETLILTRFASAVESCAGNERHELVVRRDRARFLAKLGRGTNELFRIDRDAWLAALEARDTLARGELLSDLSLADIEALVDRAEQLSEHRVEAGLRGALVGSLGWSARDLIQRRSDLSAWLDAAEASGDAEVLGAVLARFEHLPEAGVGQEGDGPWSGLLEDSAGQAWLGEFQVSLGRLRSTADAGTETEDGGGDSAGDRAPSPQSSASESEDSESGEKSPHGA